MSTEDSFDQIDSPRLMTYKNTHHGSFSENLSSLESHSKSMLNLLDEHKTAILGGMLVLHVPPPIVALVADGFLFAESYGLVDKPAVERLSMRERKRKRKQSHQTQQTQQSHQTHQTQQSQAYEPILEHEHEHDHEHVSDALVELREEDEEEKKQRQPLIDVRVEKNNKKKQHY
jgi:hypothetical protein